MLNKRLNGNSNAKEKVIVPRCLASDLDNRCKYAMPLKTATPDDALHQKHGENIASMHPLSARALLSVRFD